MTETNESAGFAALGLSEALLGTLTALGYEEPTPIQRQAIPPLLQGRDLLGQAATGTGKTAAFALPMLQRTSGGAGVPKDSRGARALILVPTRELAMQVAEAVHKYGHLAFGTDVVPIYGGQAIQQQLRALRRGVDVVVATPGRAVDHIKRGSLDLTGVEFVVLDEADEMLDMGFADELEEILEAVPHPRQTALLSATMAPRISAIAEKHLSNPVRITIKREKVAEGDMPRVRQFAYIVTRQHKLAALGRVLDMEDPTSAIVFCRTRHEVDSLTEMLASHGYRAEALHGGLSQDQRDRVMRRFKDLSLEILVATDVAARGLDIQSVSHVINYDVPNSPDAYLHRIGRTGRAGRTGVAITLAEPREHRQLRNIEQFLKQKITIEKVPTIVDLRARKLELTRVAIQETLLAGELDSYRMVVESLGAEHDIMDVAAAAVRLAHESKDGGGKDDAEIPDLREAGGAKREAKSGKREAKSGKREAKSGKREAKTEKRGAGPRWGRGKPQEDITRLYIGLGRNSGMRPADIVGAIANEAGVNPREIGAIDIADTFSIVEVPSGELDTIIGALRGTKLRGKKALVRPHREKNEG